MNSAFVDCMSMSPLVNLAGYGVEGDHFRGLAAALPTGVTVVTTLTEDGTPVGMTSGAVCSLSCEPPLVLTCIASSSKTLAEIRNRRSFCVNVLASESAEVSNSFAGSDPDKFDGVEWTSGPGGLPVLTRGITAHAVCDLYRVIRAGDHDIVIGLIVAGDFDPAASPLVYYRRNYSTV